MPFVCPQSKPGPAAAAVLNAVALFMLRIQTKVDHLALGGRDDAMAMQFLTPGWTFDDKRPCLVR